MLTAPGSAGRPGWPASAWAADSAWCYVESGSASFSGTASNPDSLVGAIVWIAFSDSVDTLYTSCAGGNGRDHTVLSDSLPTWFREMETEFEEYVDWISYGKMYLDVTTVQRPGADSLLAWDSGKTPCYWLATADDPTSPCGAGGSSVYGEGCVNLHMINEIETSLGPNYFDDFDRVFFVHLGNAFEVDWAAGWGGTIPWHGTRYNCTTCPYDGLGTTQRPIRPGDGGASSGAAGGTKWLLSHEFGHTLGIQHTPGTGKVDIGYYENMKAGAPQPVDFTDTFMPYHIFSISTLEYETGPDWFENAWFDTVTTNTLDVRIYDVRGPNRNVALVDTGVDSTESEFWLIHHQESQFDAEYGGDLLAIWHVTQPSDPDQHHTTLDLELVTGKFTTIGSLCPGIAPAPSTGLDALECDDGAAGNGDDSYRGSPADLWSAAGADTFGVGSNPNTHDYADPDEIDVTEQTVATHISIHDIRLASPPFSTGPKDYYVDVIYNWGVSSPYLYTWRGENFPRGVNLLPGSSFEGDPAPVGFDAGADFVLLPGPKAHYEEQYTLKIREDGRSTTFLDEARLIAVDHGWNSRVAVTAEGEIVVYDTTFVPDHIAGLPASIDPAVLGERNDLFHAGPGTVLTFTWNEPGPSNAGVLFSYVGQAANNIDGRAGLVIERLEGVDWVEVAHLAPRAVTTDAFIGQEVLGVPGQPIELRVRWLDIHALDLVALVDRVEPESWSQAPVELLDAEIAYKGARLAELGETDQNFATLEPGDKLTLAFAYEAPPAARTLMLGVTGYYVAPEIAGRPDSDDRRTNIVAVEHASPNPFNPTTAMTFTLSRGSQTTLAVYTVEGRLVRILHSGPLASGEHTFSWDGRSSGGAPVASGSYYYKLTAGEDVATGKLLLLK